MLKIFFMMKAQYIKTEMMYTANFWMMIFSGIVMRLLMLGIPFVIYRNIPDIAGWKESEIYLMMMLLLISESTCNVFFDGIWYLPRLIYLGGMDIYLSRPCSPLFQVLSYGVGLQGIGVFFLGFVGLFTTLAHLGMINLTTILLCIVFVITGVAVRASVYLISNSYTFWVTLSVNLPFTVYTLGEYAKYPVSIYPKWMQFILTFIIPFALISYIPLLILRGENVIPLLLFLVGFSAALVFIARFVFYKGLRKYESLGM